MFDINLLKNPGIQEKEKSKERNSSIYKKNNINKNKTIDEPEVIVEGNVSFKSILLLISICILGCSVYYYIKYINPEIVAIYMDSTDFDQTELFAQIENHIDDMNIKYIKTNKANFILNMDANDKESFYAILNDFSRYLGHQIKGYHIEDVFTLSVKTAWDIDKSNSLDLNLFDKELSDFNFNIKKELYKDKLIIISDANAMMKILQLMDNLNMIRRFFINIKVIDSIPNTIKLYQIIIS